MLLQVIVSCQSLSEATHYNFLLDESFRIPFQCVFHRGIIDPIFKNSNKAPIWFSNNNIITFYSKEYITTTSTTFSTLPGKFTSNNFIRMRADIVNNI